jgi:hypothetical protein
MQKEIIYIKHDHAFEGFSTVMNWKESLGFGRYEDADSYLKTKQ